MKILNHNFEFRLPPQIKFKASTHKQDPNINSSKSVAGNYPSLCRQNTCKTSLSGFLICTVYPINRLKGLADEKRKYININSECQITRACAKAR